MDFLLQFSRCRRNEDHDWHLFALLSSPTDKILILWKFLGFIVKIQLIKTYQHNFEFIGMLIYVYKPMIYKKSVKIQAGDI